MYRSLCATSWADVRFIGQCRRCLTLVQSAHPDKQKRQTITSATPRHLIYMDCSTFKQCASAGHTDESILGSPLARPRPCLAVVPRSFEGPNPLFHMAIKSMYNTSASSIVIKVLVWKSPCLPCWHHQNFLLVLSNTCPMAIHTFSQIPSCVYSGVFVVSFVCN
jgi:hypothetical protein